MKYQAPMLLNDDEIIELLKRSDLDQDTRIRVVLSALYYGSSNEFAGDILISVFKKAGKEEKFCLKNLFETFYDMRQNTYRIEESISFLNEFKNNNPEWELEIDSTIKNLKEYKVMYKDCPVQTSKPD